MEIDMQAASLTTERPDQPLVANMAGGEPPNYETSVSNAHVSFDNPILDMTRVYHRPLCNGEYPVPYGARRRIPTAFPPISTQCYSNDIDPQTDFGGGHSEVDWIHCFQARYVR